MGGAIKEGKEALDTTESLYKWIIVAISYIYENVLKYLFTKT